MIGLDMLAGGGIWRVATACVSVALIGTSVALWSANRALNATKSELITERATSESLRASIREQNRAVAALADAKAQADIRGTKAAQDAAIAGKRFDAALSRIASAKAVTCADAMPAVNSILESLR